MANKLFVIAWKDIYTAFKDRNAVLLMFAMPLALSLIIGLAFGTSGDVKIDKVPVGIVNEDQGTTAPGGQAVNLGQTFQAAFVPTGSAADQNYRQIYNLTNGAVYTDVRAARQKVIDGKLAALIVIPAGLSDTALNGGAPQPIDLFYDSGRSVGPSVVRSIANAIANGMNTVMLARRMGPPALAKLGAQSGQDQATIDRASAQLNAQAMTLAQSAPVQLQAVDLKGKTRTYDALQFFAPSMAILFMTFAMASGATSILVEQNYWTLQRIITTPTPRWLFMAGKLAGTYLTGIVQMVVLILSTLLLARLMGRTNPVWGTNIAGIALMVLAVVFTATSLGLVIAALARSSEQASTFSTVALFVLGMLGGSFISIQNLPKVISWLPKITLNYWGIQGFYALSVDQTSVRGIGTNVLALAVMGLVLFAISLWRFNRRLDL